MVRRPKLPDLRTVQRIPISKVPDPVIYTPWPDLFNSPTAGEAIVLTENQVNPDSVRAALIRYHDKKEFMNIEIRVRGPRGKRTVYLLNHGKDKE